MNILFTSAGRRVSLLRLFREALDKLGLAGGIIAADMQTTAPAFAASDIQELVPRSNDPGYIEALLAVCHKHKVDLLIPLIDTDLTLLAAHKKRFEEMGIRVLVSSTETNEICFDKRNTSAFFQNIGVDTPVIYDPELLLAQPDRTQYPLLIKPACGSSSKGVTKVYNARELEFFKDYIQDAIVQEFIRGEEYTIDVLTDLGGRILSIVPRLRMETRAGEVSKAMTVGSPSIENEVRRVVEALPGTCGCITVQCFLTVEGRIQFIEINPRFGGGFPLSAAAGADFPKWILQMLMNQESHDDMNGWQRGLLMLRYDEGIFINQGGLS